ncbi:MAG: histidine phosphatase family protein [Nocardioides sp.]
MDRAQGHVDVEIDDCGREQAEAAAAALAALRPVRLWSSDLTRAQQTAAYLEKATGLTAEADERLREFDLGARSGLTRPEFAERYPREFAAWEAGAEGPLVPGEETRTAVAARVGPAVGEMLAALAPGETGLAVVHGACLKVALAVQLGWPLEQGWTLKGMDNGAWAVLVQGAGEERPRLAAYKRDGVARSHAPAGSTPTRFRDACRRWLGCSSLSWPVRRPTTSGLWRSW